MPKVQQCCIAAKHKMGHSDYCKKSPDYNPIAAQSHNSKDRLPADPFAPSGQFTKTPPIKKSKPSKISAVSV